jgi:sugar (pentulose or hexulose) kinase
MSQFLAFDFGAESGRAVLGILDVEKIKLEELHRFPNRQVTILGHLHWDFDYLLNQLKKGLASAVERGYRQLSGIGIDTWGVDFGLIGEDGRLLEQPFAYRDSRTDGMMEKAFELIPKEEMYRLTGNQFMQINTVFQLLSRVEAGSTSLRDAETLLFMPDLFGFHLTGRRVSEYTIASTSQLLNARTRRWEPVIFEKLGLPFGLMAPLMEPGTVVGRLSPAIAVQTGVEDADVIAPASHDTASAVAAVPAASPNWAYVSSGTWSLLGIEMDEPILSKASLRHNFTNEGGVGGKIRFLRNTMGLWLLERCRDAWRSAGETVDYAELTDLIEEAEPFICIVDPDDPSFLNPPDMPAAVADFCKRTDQAVPETKGEYGRAIFESLALKYRFILEKIADVCAHPIEVLHIVGGGSQIELLNQWAADATGLPVVAGPTEATAVGNILIQAIAKNELAGIEEGRERVRRSFPLKVYEPQRRDDWLEIFAQKSTLFT